MDVGKKIVSIIVVIFLTVVLFSIDLPTVMPENNSGWAFDDYKQNDTVFEANGCLEITYDSEGRKYIHAIDVGSGSYSDSEGEHNIIVGKANLDLILMIGQSNAGYCNVDVKTATPKPMIGQAYYFSSHTNGSYYGINPEQGKMLNVTNIDGIANTGDKCPSICYEYYEKTHHKPYFLCGAIGAVTVSHFLPNQTAWNYAERIVVNAINTVDLNHYNLYYCPCFMWIQGESNKNTPVELYKQRFTNVFEGMSSGDFAGLEFDKCAIELLPDIYPKPREALMELAEENNTIYVGYDAKDFTLENGYTSPGDPGHYNQKADNIIGKNMGITISEKASSKLIFTDDNSIVFTLIGVIPIVLISLVVISAVWYLFNNKRD